MAKQQSITAERDPASLKRKQSSGTTNSQRTTGKKKSATSIPSSPSTELQHNAKLLAALSYLWVLSALVLVLFRGNDYISFHAKQGLVLWLLSIVFWFVPVIGWLANLAVMVLILIGFLQALEGKRWTMPYIGTLADRIRL